ncbi:unnamed protein product [Gadus morhua 'NCC']
MEMSVHPGFSTPRTYFAAALPRGAGGLGPRTRAKGPRPWPRRTCVGSAGRVTLHSAGPAVRHAGYLETPASGSPLTAVEENALLGRGARSLRVHTLPKLFLHPAACSSSALPRARLNALLQME